jgi:hypothetical protein
VKKPDRKWMLAMALSLAAGAMLAPARPALPRDEPSIAGPYHHGELVMTLLKKLFGAGGS